MATEFIKTATIYRDSSQWDSAITYFEKAIRMYEEKNLWRKKFETQAELSYTRISALQYEQAQIELRELIPEAKKRLTIRDTSVAHLLDVEGKLYNETGAYSEGKMSLLESLDIKEALKARSEDISRTLYELGNTYREMGELDLAMETYKKDLDIRKELYGDKNIHTVTVYNNIAIILKNTGRFSEALEVYLSCDSILRDLYGNDSQRRAAGLNGIAIIYAQTGKYPEALKYFNQLLTIDRSTLGENHPYLAKTYSNLGILHELMGDYKSAEDLHKKALAIKLQSFEPDNPNLISDYKGLSIIMSHIGDVDQALLYQRQVLQMEQAAYSKNDPRIATTYNMMAASLESKGDYESAWQNLKKAEEIFLNNGRDFIELGPVYHTMASNLETQGKYKEALNYAGKALKINLQAGKQHPHVAGNHVLIGTIFLDQGLIDSAQHHFQIALEIDRKVFGDKHLEVARNYGLISDAFFTMDSFAKAMENIQLAIGSATHGYNHKDDTSNPNPEQTLIPNTVASLLGAKGKILNYYATEKDDLELLRTAMSTFDAAATMIDAAQFSYKAQGSVLALREELDPVFEEAIDVAYTLYHKTGDRNYLKKAFEFSEKNKAALLVSAINESRAKTFAGIPDSLLSKENELERDLTYHEQLLKEERSATTPDVNLIEKLQTSIFDLQSKYNRLIEDFNKNYPRYYRLKYNTKISLDEVEIRFQEMGEILLEFYLGKEYLYIFTIGKNQEDLHRISIPADFLFMIEKLKTALSSNESTIDSFAKVSYDLYQYLIKPVESVLDNKKITIVPDGELGYIPFEVLISELPDSPGHELAYLIKKHSISYAFSATYLVEQSEKSAADSKLGYLAFAPNFNSRNDTGDPLNPNLLATREVVRGSLAELPGALKEVESLSKYFNGTFLQNEKANESNFKRMAHDFAIIHLATHAIIDEVNPLNSRLLFTIEGDTTNDGDLHAWELFNMQINARMAVLSACNTGFGKIQKGEGVLSLGRAFAYAGCPSRLMSLWPAQDASTADLMVSFYRSLSDGLSKDEALRIAKLDYLNNAADFNLHPFYWAGFILQGDPSPIIVKSRILPIVLGFAGLAIFGFFIFHILRRANLR
ncbi:MAG: CHAT domain-containing protein [Saprospiraceae bacterium]|nr:CHAT domain-containing protein [Saprospiraceae bacterium]